MKRISDATFLLNKERPDERIKPIRALNSPPYIPLWPNYKNNDWVYDSVLFAFPVKRADGRPVIESVSDMIEAHTEFDG